MDVDPRGTRGTFYPCRRDWSLLPLPLIVYYPFELCYSESVVPPLTFSGFPSGQISTEMSSSYLLVQRVSFSKGKSGDQDEFVQTSGYFCVTTKCSQSSLHSSTT